MGGLIQAQRRHGHRPPHIHFMIAAPGHRELVTALYFAADPYIGGDTVFGVSRALMVTPREDDLDAPEPGIPAIRYDFDLMPETGAGSGRVGADPARFMARA